MLAYPKARVLFVKRRNTICEEPSIKKGDGSVKKAKRKTVFDRILRVCLSLGITLFILLTLSVLFIGAYVRENFNSNLPDDFFTLSSIGVSPKFYVYQFSDRENRIGQREEITVGMTDGRERELLDATEIPKMLSDAFVAIEDKRFYQHRGVDWYRTTAAGLNKMIGFSDSFGGSTITQQLVKNVTGQTDLTWKRKLQEILYALDLERQMDKSEIMAWYLNIIPFSDGCEGVRAAAEHYFSKTPQELTLAECATLAAITNRPSYYNPIRYPQNNLERRNLILVQMLEQGMISEQDCAAALETPIELSVRERDADGGINSWYADMVIEDVIVDLMREYGLSRSAASRLLWHGGLQIDMAMDTAVQKSVEEYYRGAVRMPQDQNGIFAQSAVIVIDPKTGDILGVAGAVGEKDGNRMQNFATQTLRPPGSTIKPLTVYAPALEQGLIDWGSVYDDVPVEFNGNSAWPKNANGVYRGVTNIPYAVAHSTNTVAVRVLKELGNETAFHWGKERFGLKSLRKDALANDCDLAPLALGQLNYGVTLREITAAYAVFADGGQYHSYRSYYRVLDRDGRVILSNADRSEYVISEGNAAIMTKLLQGVVKHGTSSAITLEHLTECAGKTGTSSADSDRWFIGYTPELLCGVWCGYEYPRPLQERNVCTRVWNGLMTVLTQQKGGKTVFAMPNDVIRVSYCKDSGKLLSDACMCDPRQNREEIGYFLRGSEPTTFCDCHILCDYDTECGGVSHGDCNQSHLQKTGLIRVERHFPIQVLVSDAQYVYRFEPDTLEENEDPKQAYFASVINDYCGISHTEQQYNRSCTARCTNAGEEEWKYLFPRFSQTFKE